MPGPDGSPKSINRHADYADGPIRARGLPKTAGFIDQPRGLTSDWLRRAKRPRSCGATILGCAGRTVDALPTPLLDEALNRGPDLPARHAHVPGDSRLVMAAVYDEVVALGLAGNRLPDRIVQPLVRHAGPQQRAKIGRILLAEAHI